MTRMATTIVVGILYLLAATTQHIFVEAIIKGVLPTNRTRTDFCIRSHQVHNGSLPYTKALEGMNVTVAIHLNTPTIMMHVSNVTGKPIGGFMYDLQKMISERGNFTFDYVLVPNLPSSYTTTTWLKKILPHVDMYANNWYSDTSDRRASGIGFTRKVVDASLLLVTYQTITEPSADTFSYLSPFTNSLWLCIFGVVFFNGFLHWVINPATYNGRPQTLVRSVYLSLAEFVAVDNTNPRKSGSMFLNAGYSFFLLIVLAAYTANLASFLVSSNAQASTSIVSIDDANSQGATICAMKGNTALTVVQTTYPRVQVVAAATNQVPVLLEMVRNGTCDGAVVGANDWGFAVQSSLANADCGMVAVGSIFRIINGAWPYLADYSVKCTSLVETVISTILVEMNQDNSLQSLFDGYTSLTSDLSCTGVPAVIVPSVTLELADLAGIFITYAVAVMIAIILYIADKVAAVPLVKRSLEPASRYTHYVAVFVTEFMVAMVIIPGTALLSIPNAAWSKCRRRFERRASGNIDHEPAKAIGITPAGAVGIHDGGQEDDDDEDEEEVRHIELVTTAGTGHASSSVKDGYFA